MASRVITHVSTEALIRLGTSPAGPIFRHMVTVGAKVETKAKLGAPVRHGNLRSTIHALPPIPVGTTLRVIVSADAPYARYVHEGTRAHTITAKPGRVLAWTGPEGPVFATSVQHPGTKGQPFLRDALSEVK